MSQNKVLQNAFQHFLHSTCTIKQLYSLPKHPQNVKEQSISKCISAFSVFFLHYKTALACQPFGKEPKTAALRTRFCDLQPITYAIR